MCYDIAGSNINIELIKISDFCNMLKVIQSKTDRWPV